ncbi:DEAD/DEAH box helicase [Rothia nasisuis]|uniref:DEAD/DEAH box helicase n=1 Tax=Rothia nasisuis TaxID=2109647 RepID=UPI001F262CE3|nr:type ISP restriction/modification enzyme [Rothia nasisuis]
MSTTLENLLDHYRNSSTSPRDLGDCLELLFRQYLVNDGVQSQQYSKVWLWNEWPERKNFGDIGIDLVAQRLDGGLSAIQCKFYKEDHTIVKGDIDSFLSASSRRPFTHRVLVSTTSKWSKNAEEMLDSQLMPVQRIGLSQMEESNIDWSTFNFDRPEQDVETVQKKSLLPHQHKAVKETIEGFEEADRGKLIMACGTGKTFTALKIAEKFAEKNDGRARVLFMVPSLALMSQSIKAFSDDTELPLHAYAVCSDTKVGQGRRATANDTGDTKIEDLQIPATTDGLTLAAAMENNELDEGLTVVFSTYQSVDAVTAAQNAGVPDFDLIICDEAHRTTGVTLAGEDQSHFVKIHDNDLVRGDKRLYMTATPRLFNDNVKNKAKEADAVLTLMDDEAMFGPVFHRIGFGEAVEQKLLTDYKVLVLGVDENQVTSSFQGILADEDNELNIDDVAKLIGCWNGLAKRRGGAFETSFGDDLAPMKRAVAFNKSIKASQNIANEFEELVRVHLRNLDNEDPTDDLSVQVQHIDGGFNAQARAERLNWLKEDIESENPVCRILTNARCLTEGVDVPNLDAVLFLNPRNSMVDVIQAVGRVMRKAEGKKYGYIILPIAIPEGVSTAEALSDNKRYKVVWQVLQALRAHDERMDAAINQILLNDKNPESIVVEMVDLRKNTGSSEGIGSADASDAGDSDFPTSSSPQGTQGLLNFPAEEWKDGVYAKIVDKVGTREYWDDWSNDIASIAGKHISLINSLLENADAELERGFSEFVEGLQTILNPAIDRAQAVEMLAQHLITKPVFDAMFAGHKFTEMNPVSMSMQNVVDYLGSNAAFERERQSLEPFYESVQKRVAGLDSAAGKQETIKYLYDRFFQNAFPRVADRLGIVFTPVPVVDYILRSADAVLQDTFGKSLSDEGVSIIEPFVGTGTFVTRLFQLGLIRPEDMQRKYTRELYANELVLLSYYIAAINIETAYAEAADAAGVGGEYLPFEGMVLTDTFQLSESARHLDVPGFKANSERAARELEQDIQVVVMNPPYSVGQSSANDDNKNNKYPALDATIANSYVKLSTATNKNGLYDSYVRGIRWASNRINGNGVIGFISNGSFIDGNTADGIRKTFVNEFSKIYVYNLRGGIRGRSGENAKREGQNIFNIMTPVAICVLVKDSSHTGAAKLNYADIGEYLSREEKLDIITSEESIRGTSWETVVPNEAGDWINQRDEKYDSYQPIGDKATKGKKDTPAVFQLYSSGLKTNRDAWAYNFSKNKLESNMRSMIDFYASQIGLAEPVLDSTQISWNRSLLKYREQGKELAFEQDSVRASYYRPFCKQTAYFNRELNDMIYQLPKLFPTSKHKNIAIGVSGERRKNWSCLVTSTLPDLEMISKAQWMSLYTYEPVLASDGGFNLEVADGKVIGDYVRKDNITDATLKKYQEHYEDSSIAKEDIFYYIYALLHHSDYREKYEADLKKMLPRIPLARGFSEYVKVGQDLTDLHLNYESAALYPLKVVYKKDVPTSEDAQYDFFRVKKMSFGKGKDQSKIIYNENITFEGIPDEAYGYEVNGRSALAWIIESYQVKTHKDSQITNDPNDYSREVGNPRYIADLLQRIMTVSLETQRLVNSLPKFEVTE